MHVVEFISTELLAGNCIDKAAQVQAAYHTEECNCSRFGHGGPDREAGVYIDLAKDGEISQVDVSTEIDVALLVRRAQKHVVGEDLEINRIDTSTIVEIAE